MTAAQSLQRILILFFLPRLPCFATLLASIFSGSWYPSCRNNAIPDELNYHGNKNDYHQFRTRHADS